MNLLIIKNRSTRSKRIKIIFVTMIFIFFTIKFAQADESSFSDNYIEYRFGTAFKEPAVAGGADIQKNIASFTHFNTDKLGSNFLKVDGLFSDDTDPAENSVHGASEVYAIFRRDWSLSALTGKDFSIPGIIRDVAIHMGADMKDRKSVV